MVDRNLDISMVIPAFNEEKRIAGTLRSVSEYFRARGIPYQILVVDDGSRDRTSEIVRNFQVEDSALRLIRLPRNHGKGYAVRIGMINCHGKLLIFNDADGATPIQEIDKLERAIKGGFDIAIGSRALRDPTRVVNDKLHRRVMGVVFNRFVQGLTVKGITDTQCGFKMFRREVAHDLFNYQTMDGFSFDVEILLIAQLQNYKIAEVPVNWTAIPGSKVNLFLDSFQMVTDLFKIRGNYLRGHYAAAWRVPSARPVG